MLGKQSPKNADYLPDRGGGGRGSTAPTHDCLELMREPKRCDLLRLSLVEALLSRRSLDQSDLADARRLRTLDDDANIVVVAITTSIPRASG
jgi:hypothetical protein